MAGVVVETFTGSKLRYGSPVALEHIDPFRVQSLNPFLPNTSSFQLHMMTLKLGSG